MRRIPSELKDEFSNRGDSFDSVVETLYTNYDREFTQTDLVKEVDITQPRISEFTQELVDSDWIKKRKGRTTYSWNTELHNPASTDGTKAISGFYSDLGWLIKKHSETRPGLFAILGAGMFVAAIVLLSFFIGYLVNGNPDSGISGFTYLAISLGSLLVGVVITLLSPMHAWLHRFARWITT
jgi:predicted transcriptional regulator